MKRRLAAGAVGLGIGVAVWVYIHPAPTGPEPARYTVVAGDTLWKIAEANGVSLEDLRSWNGIEGDRIEVGQELLLWAGEGGASKRAEPAREAARSRKSTSGGSVHAGGTASDAGSLSMPDAKPCLAMPEGTDGGEGTEPDMVAAAGLSREQISASMSAFLPRLSRCVPEGTTPEGTVTLTITVGCDGRVASIEVDDDGGMDAGLVGCVPDTLRYAPFPAHDMPDGEVFRFPVTFSAE